MLKALLIIIAVLIGLVLGWHLIFFLLGGAIAISASIWAIIVASIILFCCAILALFVLTGVGIFVLGFLTFAWTLIAVFAFPVLFPVLVPLFIVLLLLAYYRRREQNKLTSPAKEK